MKPLYLSALEKKFIFNFPVCIIIPDSCGNALPWRHCSLHIFAFLGNTQKELKKLHSAVVKHKTRQLPNTDM
jgi:hypothetical protein